VKVSFPPDKHVWHPSVLSGQIVLVSTVDAEGLPNVAPKSWVTMVAFAGPIVAFGCNVTHATYSNVVATKEFVLNVLPESLAERAWALSDLHGQQRLRECGLTPMPAQKVRAPLVDECPAHLECQLDDVKRYGEEVFIFGRVVAASIEKECIEAPLSEQYERLAPTFFLEAGTYAGLGRLRRIDGDVGK
jgi:flavin reductase (DIM6/NTAB) family NADH-FMN oxidoreductase RutF